MINNSTINTLCSDRKMSDITQITLSEDNAELHEECKDFLYLSDDSQSSSNNKTLCKLERLNMLNRLYKKLIYECAENSTICSEKIQQRKKINIPAQIYSKNLFHKIKFTEMVSCDDLHITIQINKYDIHILAQNVLNVYKLRSDDLEESN